MTSFFLRRSVYLAFFGHPVHTAGAVSEPNQVQYLETWIVNGGVQMPDLYARQLEGTATNVEPEQSEIQKQQTQLNEDQERARKQHVLNTQELERQSKDLDVRRTNIQSGRAKLIKDQKEFNERCLNNTQKLQKETDSIDKERKRVEDERQKQQTKQQEHTNLRERAEKLQNEDNRLRKKVQEERDVMLRKEQSLEERIKAAQNEQIELAEQRKLLDHQRAEQLQWTITQEADAKIKELLNNERKAIAWKDKMLDKQIEAATKGEITLKKQLDAAEELNNELTNNLEKLEKECSSLKGRFEEAKAKLHTIEKIKKASTKERKALKREQALLSKPPEPRENEVMEQIRGERKTGETDTQISVAPTQRPVTQIDIASQLTRSSSDNADSANGREISGTLSSDHEARDGTSQSGRFSGSGGLDPLAPYQPSLVEAQSASPEHESSYDDKELDLLTNVELDTERPLTDPQSATRAPGTQIRPTQLDTQQADALQDTSSILSGPNRAVPERLDVQGMHVSQMKSSEKKHGADIADNNSTSSNVPRIHVQRFGSRNKR
jgi:hypothetical protein